MARHDEWFTARASNDVGNCVETLLATDAVRIRDSKDRGGGTLTVTHDGWRAFVRAVRDTATET